MKSLTRQAEFKSRFSLLIQLITNMFIMFAFLVYSETTAVAGEITLLINTTTRVQDHHVYSEFQISNTGSETARNVWLQTTFLNQQHTVSVAVHIPPGESGTTVLDFTVPPEIRGDIPIFATVSYQEAQNGDRFSSAAIAIAQASEAPASDLTLDIVRKIAKQQRHILRIELNAPWTSLTDITLSCHVPDDLNVFEPQQQIQLRGGNASAECSIENRRGLPGSRYEVFVTAEYEQNGIRYLAYTSTVIPIEEGPARLNNMTHLRKNMLLTLGICTIGSLFAALLNHVRRMRPSLPFPPTWQQPMFDVLILAAIELFILSTLSPEHLVTTTTTTGGDTASHYYTLEYLRHELLPHGRISGWNPGNLAGFPMLQLYFPLPFLLMCILDWLVPLQVAFKLGTLFGIFLLPVAMYSMLRLVRCGFSGPAIGAACTLPFLFNSTNSMWGGNILSTLAGEFAYSLSLSLALILLGNLYRGCIDDRHLMRNALLVFLVGFSHGYTLLFVEMVSFFFLLTPQGFLKRLTYLVKVYTIGFLLLAFWLIPLLAFLDYTIPYQLAWEIHSAKAIFPDLLFPVVIGAGISTLGLLIWRCIPHTGNSSRFHVRTLAFLWFGVWVAGVMFIAAPELGVVDIRYVPCGQLMVCAIAGLGAGCLGKWLARFRFSGAYTIGVVTALMWWTNTDLGPVPDWAVWNYEGFERKDAWPLFRTINEILEGSFQDPRIVYEHSPRHNIFGSTRAFESLPLFSGRATLEGLYMSASPNSPFIFYLQSEISKEQSCPYTQYACAAMDFGRARNHLQLFHVKDIVLRSPEAKRTIRRYPDYQLLHTLDEYEIWEFTRDSDGYVAPLRYEPVFLSSTNWKTDTYRWFIDEKFSSVHIVSGEKNPPPQFTSTAASLESLTAIPIDTSDCRIVETIYNNEILIETNWVNKPLLVKFSYHPNWHIEGAERIYRISPDFMLIFPTQKHVRLYYAPGRADWLGRLFTGIGWLILLLNVPLPRQAGHTLWMHIAGRYGISLPLALRVTWNPGIKVRRTILLGGMCAGFFALALAMYQIASHDPNRWFNQARKLLYARQFAGARAKFSQTRARTESISRLAADSAYFIGLSYYRERLYTQAIEAFEAFIAEYPYQSHAPSAYYYIGECYAAMEQAERGIAQFQQVIERFPQSEWAGHAEYRLRELQALKTPVNPGT